VDIFLKALIELRELAPASIPYLITVFIFIYAWNERRRGTGADFMGSVAALRRDLDDHRDKTDSHLIVIEGRVADNYAELLRFKTEVAKELATKDDLREAERRIKEHITHALMK
jgi:hypothetical protein